MFRKQLVNLATELGVRIVPAKDLPPTWWAAYDSETTTIEITEKADWFIILHELCHALQHLSEAEIWNGWAEGTVTDGELELDCELRAIGWLHENGHKDKIEAFVKSANRNLKNYHLRLV